LDSSPLLDISRLLGRAAKGRRHTGIDRVCLAYVARFGDRAQAILQWGSWRRIVPHRESQELFALLMRPGNHFARDATAIIARACIPPWPSQHGLGRMYFNLGHTGLDHPGLVPWLRRTHQRPVYLVHDLIPITHPEYCRAGEAQRHIRRLQVILRTGAGVLANSQATLNDLCGFAKAHELPCPPAVVAPLGTAALDFDRDLPAPLNHPYFVVVGTIEPRKNHLLLLNVWRQMIAETGNRTPHLVVVGQRGWECENVVDLLERCSALGGFVHELADCSDALMARYVAHARALLFPSFTEGYGLPLVEALMLGTPVIASPLAAFNEVAGTVPEYLDPLDGPAWAKAVRDYTFADHPRRTAQLQRMRDFRVPTWNNHFHHVEALLERLA